MKKVQDRFWVTQKKSLTVSRLFAFSIAVLLLFASLLPLYGQTNSSANNDRLIVKRTNDFVVTGDGNAENWKITDWNNLQQHSSNTLKSAGWDIPSQTHPGITLQYKTFFKVLYSNTGLYCLFRCEDSIITATLKGDFLNLFTEDVVEIFLKPDTSFPAYFEYELSPLNYELPILILNKKGNITGWKPFQYEGTKKTRHSVKINEKNPDNNRFVWSAEVFIPFRLLVPMTQMPPKKGTQWRANFYRIDYDHDPVYFGWQLTRQSFHDPDRFGIIEFE